MKSKFSQSRTFLASLLLLVGFFLPWIKIFFGSFSGYELAQLLNDPQIDVNNAYLLYALPISALIVLIQEIRNKSSIPFVIAIIRVVPFAVLVFLTSKLILGLGDTIENTPMESYIKILDIGAYMTLVGSLLLIFPERKETVGSTQVSHEVKNKEDQKSIEQDTVHEKHPFQDIKIETIKTFLSQFLKEYKYRLITLGAVLILAIASYLIFIKDYPGKEASKLVKEFCECNEAFDNEMAPLFETMSEKLDQGSFTERTLAMNEFSRLNTQVDHSKSSQCYKSASTRFDQLRNAFEHPGSENKFDTKFQQLQGKCSTDSIEEKRILQRIKSIPVKMPDVDRLKSDLLGKKTSHWTFSYDSEVKQFEVVSSNITGNILQYQTSIVVVDFRNKLPYHLILNIVYRNDDYVGWVFGSFDELLFEPYVNAAQNFNGRELIIKNPVSYIYEFPKEEGRTQIFYTKDMSIKAYEIQGSFAKVDYNFKNQQYVGWLKLSDLIYESERLDY